MQTVKTDLSGSLLPAGGGIPLIFWGVLMAGVGGENERLLWREPALSSLSPGTLGKQPGPFWCCSSQLGSVCDDAHYSPPLECSGLINSPEILPEAHTGPGREALCVWLTLLAPGDRLCPPPPPPWAESFSCCSRGKEGRAGGAPGDLHGSAGQGLLAWPSLGCSGQTRWVHLTGTQVAPGKGINPGFHCRMPLE